MEKKRGIWIDRHKAMIVDPENGTRPFKTVFSDLNNQDPERPYRDIYRNPEKKLQAKKEKMLRDYYEHVIDSLDEESELFIFGPASAKNELQKQIGTSYKQLKCVGVENEEKFTDNQVVARVKDYFKMRRW